MFLTTNEGDTFITLDQPFKLSMEPGDFIEQDAGTCVKAAYCLQYKLGGPNGWTIQNAGIVFLQFMSWHRHHASLSTLGSIMKDKIADFSAKIACIQARQATAAISSQAVDVVPESIWCLKFYNDVVGP